MSNDWFRSWHGAPTDHKWALIAKRAGVKPIHVSGTFWALLDHASQHSDRGYVDDFDIETFALFAGLEEDHVSRIVTTLSDKGLIVDGYLASWGKRQPKKEDDTAADRKRRERAKNGGKPPVRGGDGSPDQKPKGNGHAASRDVTLDKIRLDKKEEDSVANATGTVVPHPAADFCKAVFDSAIPLLKASGRTERDARSVIGRWRKTCGDAELLTLIRHSEIEGHSDPLEWIMAAVETRNGNRKPATVRGSRPDPSLDMLYAARAAAEGESGDGQDYSGAWTSLPSFGAS